MIYVNSLVRTFTVTTHGLCNSGLYTKLHLCKMVIHVFMCKIVLYIFMYKMVVHVVMCKMVAHVFIINYVQNGSSCIMCKMVVVSHDNTTLTILRHPF